MFLNLKDSKRRTDFESDNQQDFLYFQNFDSFAISNLVDPKMISDNLHLKNIL